jgi:hypothetical protein
MKFSSTLAFFIISSTMAAGLAVTDSTISVINDASSSITPSLRGRLFRRKGGKHKKRGKRGKGGKGKGKKRGKRGKGGKGKGKKRGKGGKRGSRDIPDEVPLNSPIASAAEEPIEKAPDIKAVKADSPIALAEEPVVLVTPPDIKAVKADSPVVPTPTVQAEAPASVVKSASPEVPAPTSQADAPVSDVKTVKKESISISAPKNATPQAESLKKAPDSAGFSVLVGSPAIILLLLLVF